MYLLLFFGGVSLFHPFTCPQSISFLLTASRDIKKFWSKKKRILVLCVCQRNWALSSSACQVFGIWYDVFSFVEQCFWSVFLRSCKLYFSILASDQVPAGCQRNWPAQHDRWYLVIGVNCISHILGQCIPAVFLSYCERPSAGWLLEELSSSARHIWYLGWCIWYLV